MPSKSKKQARLMAAVAHNSKFAKKVGIPQSVGREFNDADRVLRKYAKGGEVLPSSTDEDEDWTDTYLKRPLSGLASMWGGVDPETGEFVSPALHNIKRVWNADERRKAGLPRQKMPNLGIVDEVISLPALGEIVGLPAPQFSKDAEERAGTTREAARDAIGVDAPHGFIENLTESAGVMAGQMPVPASLANRLKLLKESGKLGKAGKVLGPAVEWFSPTVVPKVKNYLQGTLFGGMLGGGLDYLEDHLDEKEQEERNRQFISEVMAEVLEEERVKSAQESGDEMTDDEALAELGYAEGGKVSAAREAIRTLRDKLKFLTDENARRAQLDAVVKQATAPGIGIPFERRAALQTGIGGLSDALADTVPERRRGRYADYEKYMLDQLEATLPHLHDPEALPDETVILRAIAGPDAAPGPVLPAQAPRGHGLLTQQQWEEALQRSRALAASRGLKYAKGGLTGSNTGSATKSPAGGVDYEHYGEGPEYLFLGDRIFNPPEGWGPVHPAAPAAPHTDSGSDYSWIAPVGVGALAAYDWYKDRNNLDNATIGGTGSQADVEAWNDAQLQGIEAPELQYGLWNDIKNAGAGMLGALGLYGGAERGGTAGAGQALSGAGDMSDALEHFDLPGGGYGDTLSGAGDVLSGISQGGVEGYGQAAVGAGEIANSFGFDQFGNYVPIIGGLMQAYQGAQGSSPASVASTMAGLYNAGTAAGMLSAPAAGAGTYAAGTGATGALGTLGSVAGPAALGFAVADISNAYLDKKDARYDKYAAGNNFIPLTTPTRGRLGARTYYVMNNGKVISREDMEWLARLSRDTGKGNQEADDRHSQALANLMSDDWHSTRISDLDKKWLTEQGYSNF